MLTPQSRSRTATYHLSRKLSKLDEPDMQDTARRHELISDILLWRSSHGRAKARRSARTYIQQLCADKDVALRTYRERWTIEMDGERGSGRYVLAA